MYDIFSVTSRCKINISIYQYGNFWKNYRGYGAA